MLRNEPDTAELLLKTCFKIGKLKETLKTDENRALINFSNSYDYLNNTIKEALKSGDIVLLREKLNELINFTNDILQLNNNQTRGIQNYDLAIYILEDIQDYLRRTKKAIDGIISANNLKY